MKVIVAVLTAERMPYLKRIQACKDTWIRYAPDWARVWVLSGPKLGVPDSYDMMTFKIKALCRRLLMDPSWDWTLRVDDDVCVDWRAVKPPKEGDYVGPIVPNSRDYEPYTQGAVTWLSRRAVQAIYDHIQTCKGFVEDAEVGLAMSKAGIKPTQLDVYQVTKGAQVTEWAAEELHKFGFVLEVPTPEIMRSLHASLGLPSLERKPTMTESKSLTPAVPMSAVYRDMQGRMVVRNQTTFNGECGPAPARGPAVSRPQEDKAWFVK